MYMLWLTVTLIFALALGVFALPPVFDTADYGDSRARALADNLLSWHGATTRHVIGEVALGRNPLGDVSPPSDPYGLADYSAFGAWHSLRAGDLVVTYVTPEEQTALGSGGIAFQPDSVLRLAADRLQAPYHIGVLRDGEIVSPIDNNELTADPDCPLSPLVGSVDLSAPEYADPRYAGCNESRVTSPTPLILGGLPIPDGSWVLVSGVPAPAP